MRPWHLGNTTVRSPFRLRDGLVALSNSPLQGNLRGRAQEIAFRNLLGSHEIVELGDDETYSVGRKWRGALGKLGFLYPEVPKSTGIAQNDIGSLDTITPNGQRLVNAESVPAMQECFLRALAAYYIPSVLETSYSFPVFSPLRHTLAVMLELEKITGESTLGFMEMAVIVQLTSTNDDMSQVIQRILDLRERRTNATNKRQFDGQQKERAAKIHDYAANTFSDYADTNFRYLKATGLVQNKGRGLSLIPEKRVLIERLVQDTTLPDSVSSYFTALCNGAALPTDNKDAALDVLNDLITQLQKRGIQFSLKGKSLNSPADIALVRHEIEELIARLNEEAYAKQQATMWEEIAAFMEIIIHRRREKTLSNGEVIKVPQAEARKTAMRAVSCSARS